jgi:hypothetical protein
MSRSRKSRAILSDIDLHESYKDNQHGGERNRLSLGSFPEMQPKLRVRE